VSVKVSAGMTWVVELSNVVDDAGIQVISSLDQTRQTGNSGLIDSNL
jgi:hypothetical protein